MSYGRPSTASVHVSVDDLLHLHNLTDNSRYALVWCLYLATQPDEGTSQVAQVLSRPGNHIEFAGTTEASCSHTGARLRCVIFSTARMTY